MSVCGTVSADLALEDFLGTPVPTLAPLSRNSRSPRGLRLADLPTSHPWMPEGSFREPRSVEGCVPPSEIYRSAGILTCCPSTTPFGLALGPTNPGTICVALETLGLRWTGFSPVFLLLMPTFSLPNAPRCLTASASAQIGMLPYQYDGPETIDSPRLRYRT